MSVEFKMLLNIVLGLRWVREWAGTRKVGYKKKKKKEVFFYLSFSYCNQQVGNYSRMNEQRSWNSDLDLLLEGPFY